MNEEGVVISDLGESLGEIFAATAHNGLVFHVIFIFCLHRTLLQNLQKFPYIMLLTQQSIDIMLFVQ